MSVATAKWTVDEYHRLINTGALEHKPVELLQGDIVQMSPEGPLHSNRIRQSAKQLRQQMTAAFEISETHPITLENSEPEPDLAVIRAGDYDEQHPSATDTLLVIEFANSSLEKDLEEKRLTYAQAKIGEYWVVNLRDRQVIIFLDPLNGDYQTRQVVFEGVLRSQVCPEISIFADILLGTV